MKETHGNQMNEMKNRKEIKKNMFGATGNRRRSGPNYYFTCVKHFYNITEVKNRFCTSNTKKQIEVHNDTWVVRKEIKHTD